MPPLHLATHTYSNIWRPLSHHVGHHGWLLPCGTEASGSIGDQSRDASCFHWIPSHERRVHVFLSVCQPLQDLLLRGGNVILPFSASEWRDDQGCHWPLQLSLQIQHHLLESAHLCTGIDRLWCNWLDKNHGPEFPSTFLTLLQSQNFGCALEVDLFDPLLGPFDESFSGSDLCFHWHLLSISLCFLKEATNTSIFGP